MENNNKVTPKNILCLSDSIKDIDKFTKKHNIYLYKISHITPTKHDFLQFEKKFEDLKNRIDLGTIDLIIAEYVESLPLLYFIRKLGYTCPAIMIPHCNPYPLDVLMYFLLVRSISHPLDTLLCGSLNSAAAFTKLLGIKALPICTFGIKSDFKKLNHINCKKKWGLENYKVGLYTGRFMNDKGLESLLQVHQLAKRKFKNFKLIISTSHIEPNYYNQLTKELDNVTLYFRLPTEKLVELYNAADVYMSCAVSVFETYGKAPLESLACGTPVLLPAWDGFKYFINNDYGQLAKLHYTDSPSVTPFQFARVDIEDYSSKLIQLLEKPKRIEKNIPNWALYFHNISVYENLINEIFKQPTENKLSTLKEIPNSTIFSQSVKSFFEYYKISTLDDLTSECRKNNIISRRDIGPTNLRKAIHDEIFKTADDVKETILDQRDLTLEEA